MENQPLRPLDFKGDGEPEKMDLRLVRAASYRELGHWVAIFGLDGAHLHEGEGFAGWLQACGLDVREMDEGGIVVRKGDGAFFFLDPPAVASCDSQFRRLRQQVLGGDPLSGDTSTGQDPA